MVWAARPASQPPSSGLSVTCVGLTNSVSGRPLVQFDVANAYRRRVRFGVGDVQIRQTNRWPSSVRVSANWLSVAAGSHRVFSVPAPPVEGAAWRVPLIYQVEPPTFDRVRNQITDWALFIARWRPGRTVALYRGIPPLFINGPEMTGLSNQPAQQTEGSRSSPPTTPASAAAEFHR